MSGAGPSVDARVRLAAAVGAWGVALAAPHPASAGAVATLALALRIGKPRPLRTLLPPLAVGLLAAALLAAAGGGRAALLLARVVAAGWIAGALLAWVSRAELLAALGWARVPSALLEILATADRQRHAIGSFAAAVRDAQRLRLGWTGPLLALRSAASLAGLTTLRTVVQAEIASDALALRGGRGRPPPPLQPIPGWGNALFAAAAAAALAACLLAPRLLPT